MQVAAYTSGKDSVSLLDCMLLQHILWQQPDQQSRITDFLLSQISEDDGLQSASYILGSESLAYNNCCTTMLPACSNGSVIASAKLTPAS